MKSVLELRFIERDGKKILQQKVGYSGGDILNLMFQDDPLWEDVPFVEEA